MLTRRLRWLWLLVAVMAVSCAPYSFSGGRTALVQTVAVPTFENRTTEFGLPDVLTRGIIDGFVNDNQIKIVDQGQAEAILSGSIAEYKRSAYTFDQSDRVTEYIVEIWVDASLRKRGSDEEVWSAERMRGFGVYKADTEDEQAGQKRAIDKLAEDILNRTIKSW
jgi:hypothetical protein